MVLDELRPYLQKDGGLDVRRFCMEVVEKHAAYQYNLIQNMIYKKPAHKATKR